MDFGTKDTYETFAIVMIPPGNILKDILLYREKIFSSMSFFSAKAFFSYPVLFWAEEKPNKEDFEKIYRLTNFPFELSQIKKDEKSVFMGFTDEKRIESVKDAIELRESKHFPFESGKGLFCCYQENIDRDYDEIKSCLKAKTWHLAVLDCTFGPGLTSTWEVLMEKRIRKLY